MFIISINVIISLLTILFLGVCNYGLVVFIDFCFNEGNIFDWYYIFLLDRIKPKSPKIAKMLGLCAVCFGFWVGLFSYILYWRYLNVPPVGFLIFTAISEFLLINQFVWNDEN